MPTVDRPIPTSPLPRPNLAGPLVDLFRRLRGGGRDRGSAAPGPSTPGKDRYVPSPAHPATPGKDTPPLLRPMPGVITQGVRPGHPALDIACMVGTPVKAAHDGKGGPQYSHTHGNVFGLRGSDGLETRYAHLDSTKPGGTYKRGEVIGACGNTGAWTTGPHLHFESNRPELLNRLADS